MNLSLKIVLSLVIPGLPMSVQAHKAWLLPSETVLSAADPWITVDAAVSNDLFYFNHAPLRLDGLAITGPDGKLLQAENRATGKFRSTFDLHLLAPGTYRIAVVNRGLSASWEVDGKPRRWRGSVEAFAAQVPADAKALKVTESAGRIETFVTSGKPDTGALKPTGIGLELIALTHPNDLFAGESASFTLLLDGKPMPGLAIAIIADGIRYRSQQNEISTSTDQQGRFSVTWPAAGRYWLEASLEDDKTSLAPARNRRVSYAATLEVMPQ